MWWILMADRLEANEGREQGIRSKQRSRSKSPDREGCEGLFQKTEVQGHKKSANPRRFVES